MLSARPEIKICGLTRPRQAESCVQAGADAIGLVFYERSPRNVDSATAAEICTAVRGQTCAVGVFVDASYDRIMARVNRCGLDAVQLHGNENQNLVDRLKLKNVIVLKALFASRPPRLDAAAVYAPDAFLVECGLGKRPGGNARTWDWRLADCVKSHGPVILAGGLHPGNVRRAIASTRPAGIDVSSGVEAAAGRKDIQKVIDFIQAVGDDPIAAPDRRIFAHDKSPST